MNRTAQKQQDAKEYCRARLAAIVSEGLEPLPACAFELDALLNVPVVDVAKVSRALRSDILFSHRILRLSNTILSRSKESAHTVTDAAILLGPCLFHTAVLLCAVTEFGAHASRNENAEALWSHSVETAVTAESIASQNEYPVRGAAYVAGLLHDIGALPLLMIAREQSRKSSELSAIPWRDNIELEREIFGLDHCEIGRWMAKSWQFPPALVEAVLHHHDPQVVRKQSPLAEIVWAAESHCSALSAQACS